MKVRLLFHNIHNRLNLTQSLNDRVANFIPVDSVTGYSTTIVMPTRRRWGVYPESLKREIRDLTATCMGRRE